MSKQLNLIYALKDGKIVYIDDVERGLKCDCYCPACGEPLVAKKGDRMIHHFAHHVGHNCEYGYESSLHLAAKDILSKTKKFTLPDVYLEFPDSYKEKELISESKTIEIDSVQLEKRFESIIPDVVLYSGDKFLFVEIYVTHKIDKEKLSKIQKSNISTIEIDLSRFDKTLSKNELENILLSNHKCKTWKYNAWSKKYLDRFYKVCDKFKIIERGHALHIDNCPIKSRIWKGKPYANFMDDCLYCEYCISSSDNKVLLCSGRLRVSKIDDFTLDASERIERSNAIINKSNEEAFENGICPNCGGNLAFRNSSYGVFWGCSNYPHCRFKAFPNHKTGEIEMKF